MVSIIDRLGDLLIEHGERIVLDQTVVSVAREPIGRLLNQQSTSDLLEERRGILFGEARLRLGLVRFQSEIVRWFQREMVTQARNGNDAHEF